MVNLRSTFLGAWISTKPWTKFLAEKKKQFFSIQLSLSLGAFHAQEVVVPWPAEGPLTALLSCLSGFDTWMCLPLRKWFRMFRTMCNGYTQVAHGIFTDIFILHTYIFYPYCILSKGVWFEKDLFVFSNWDDSSQPTGDRKKNTGMHNELKLALRTYPTLCHCYPTYPIPLRTFFCSTCAQRIGHFGSHLSMLPETEPALSPGWWYHW